MMRGIMICAICVIIYLKRENDIIHAKNNELLMIINDNNNIITEQISISPIDINAIIDPINIIGQIDTITPKSPLLNIIVNNNNTFDVKKFTNYKIALEYYNSKYFDKGNIILTQKYQWVNKNKIYTSMFIKKTHNINPFDIDPCKNTIVAHPRNICKNNIDTNHIDLESIWDKFWN